MSPDHLILACRHCGTKNNVPAKRLQNRPVCGNCHLPLQTEAFVSSTSSGGKRDKYLTYRGNIQAISGRKAELIFVTLHPEKHPTGLYRLNTESHTLKWQPLPCGAAALAVSPKAVYAGGINGAIFDCSNEKDATQLAHQFETTPIALALLSEARLAVMVEDTIGILDVKTGELQQTLPLPENEPGTCMAADRTGRFLVAGTSRGTVMLFEAETQTAFQLSDAARLHGGAVTALLFEPDDTRFLSAGNDAKLLSTHVRGA